MLGVASGFFVSQGLSKLNDRATGLLARPSGLVVVSVRTFRESGPRREGANSIKAQVAIDLRLGASAQTISRLERDSSRLNKRTER
jgi:hypothetical protein